MNSINRLNKAKNDRENWIDTLRFLAFLLIMVRHFEVNFQASFLFDIFGSAFKRYQDFYSGSLGVAFFCVLLGYFVADKLWENRGSDLSAAGPFIIHRYIRFLIPLLIVNSLVFLLKAQYLDDFQPFSALTAIGVFNNMGAGVNNIKSLFSDSFFFTCNIVKTFWCMDQFFIGSIICAMLLLCFGLERKRWIHYFFAAIVILLSSDVWIFNCILGMILFDAYQSKLKAFRVNNSILVFIYLALAIILPWVSVRGTTVAYIRYGFAACFLLLFCLNSIKIQRLLDLKPLAWLGQRSFSLYLVHTPVHWFFTYFFIGSLYTYIPYSYLLISSFIVTLSIDICLAHLLFKVGETYVPKKLEQLLFSNLSTNRSL